MGEWKKTDLFVVLQARNTTASQAVQQSLNDCLPEIERILRSGGTSPSRFTLHDSDHSFRVAQMMASLAGEEFLTSSSDIEIAMSLLAAYLHDIGMTPERNLAKRHWNYLVTGNKDLLSSEEQSELQLWLDAEWQGKEPPFLHGQITPEGIDQVEAIFSYYCRHKHNDWSGHWIAQHLTGLRAPIYSGWTQDLIALCGSHHESLSTLRSSKFDARVIGSQGKTLNLRYLAALLRVADILEFDPERTPEIILRHRDIPPESRIFWYRDHGISLRLDKPGKQLILSARTPNALVHRAVLETVDAIDQELSSCAILEREGAFRQGSIPEQERELYRWNWAPRLLTDIAERDKSFVYIDGTFRPNSKRILELLSGTQLYGTTLAALRELLQNATDAVREQIAYERLTKDTPGDPQLEAALSEIHKIQIVIYKGDDGRLWLRCSDDGVGMTRDIIERHLLISGSTTRAEVRALERSARNFGFNVGRTGQFGIGVLSYFMIADQVEILTRRSTEAGDADGTGWKFKTQGIGEFGQLEPIYRNTNGTEIKLRLREQAPHDVNDWEIAISRYCKQILVFAPCVVEFRTAPTGREWRIGPGWTWEPDNNVVLAQFFGLGARISDSPDEPYETTASKEKRRSLVESWRKIQERAAKQLRWTGPKPAVIGKFGHGRAWVPYFEIEGDASLIYLDGDLGRVEAMPDDCDFLNARIGPQISWKGFKIEENLEHDAASQVLLEANLTAGLDPSINRENLTGPDLKNLSSAIHKAEVEALAVFATRFQKSRFNAINFAVCHHGRNPSALDAYWVQSFTAKEPGKLLPLDSPCVDLAYFPSHLLNGEYFWRGKRIRMLKALKGLSGPRIWAGGVLQDGKLALLRFPESFSLFGLTPVWFWDADGDVVSCGHNYCERFPSVWKKLMIVVTDHLVFYNRDHEWVKLIASKGELYLSGAKAYACPCVSHSNERRCNKIFILAGDWPERTRHLHCT